MRVAAAVLTVALVPLGLVSIGHLPDGPTGATTAQPAAALSTPAYAPNWIAIETGATSRITLNDAGGRVGDAQTLAPAANCGVNLGRDAASHFIDLAGSTGSTPSESLASYAVGSLGVKEKKSGVSCYQVNAVTTESLQIALGPNVATQLGDDAVATSAYLDVELKGGVRILATATLHGTVTGTFELQSGSERSTAVTSGAVEYECNPSPDSGADSNVSDNCRWPISVPSWLGSDDGVVFDMLTLQAKAGAFSVEGGADGAVLPAAPNSTPNASIIELAADTLGCNASTPVEPATSDAPSVSVYRIGNADGSTCQLVPYALGNGPGFAQFLKPLDSQTSAQFIWDITGLLSPIPGTTDLPDIKIDYETPDPTTGASPVVSLGWCPDATFVGGRFAGYTAAQVAGLPDQDDYTGKQYACVIKRTATSVDGGTGNPDRVQVNDLVYVYGDAKLGW